MRKVARGNELTNMLTLSLSLSRTLVTPTTSTPPWCEIIRAAFLPCVPSRANRSVLGYAATNLLVGPGTPRGRNADIFRRGGGELVELASGSTAWRRLVDLASTRRHERSDNYAT
jgi:hypothetical protein